MYSAIPRPYYRLLFFSFFIMLSQCEDCVKPWHGPQCKFRCNCDVTNCYRGQTCDLHPRQCHTSWFGFYCSYRDVATKASISVANVTDNDLSTCSPPVDSVTAEFGSDTHFTWLRLVMKGKGSKVQGNHSFKLDLKDPSSTRYFPCPQLSVIPIDDVTFDLACVLPGYVHVIKVSWTGNRSVCTLNVSGGRNLALAQRSEMSSRFTMHGITSRADAAVDGSRLTEITVVSDCAHTEPGDPRPSLDIYFSRPSLVHEYVIYNRAGDLNYQLQGFNLTSYNQRSEEVLTYTDQLTQPLSVYVIKTRVQAPVSRVSLAINEYPPHVQQRTKMLVVCEVEAYGDCKPPLFGLACNDICSIGCKDQACHFNGHCYHCPPGRTGKFCIEGLNKPETVMDYGEFKVNKTNKKEDEKTDSDDLGSEGSVRWILIVLCAVFICLCTFCLCCKKKGKIHPKSLVDEEHGHRLPESLKDR